MSYPGDNLFSLALRRAAFAAAFMAGVGIPLIPRFVPGIASRPIRREIARVASPNLRHDAILLETRAGLITRRASYEVYIVRHNMPTAGASPVLSAAKEENLTLAWRGGNALEIAYRRIRIEQFTNYWPHAREGNPPMIEIRLAPVSDGFSYLVAGRKPNAPATLPVR